MKTIGTGWKKWLKSLHILFASLWVTGGISIALMLFILDAESDGQLYGINMAMHLIDMGIIVTGNTGVLLTGLVYSVFTNWGWFKHRWITVKWIIAVAGMLFGIFFLAPWDAVLLEQSQMNGLAALENPSYIHSHQMLLWFGTLQAAVVIFALFISSLRPWRRERKP